MRLPHALATTIHERSFWRSYLQLPNVKGMLVQHVSFGMELPILGGFGLTLDAIERVRLGVRVPEAAAPIVVCTQPRTSRRVQEALDAGLRPDEVEIVASLQALADPDLRHPGYVTLLLFPFVIATTIDELNASREMLNAAVSATSAVAEDDVATLLAAVAVRPTFPSRPAEVERMLSAARASYAAVVRSEWRTPHVEALAKTFIETRDPELLIVLHDALLEARCEHEGLLAMLKHQTRADWLIALLAGQQA